MFLMSLCMKSLDIFLQYTLENVMPPDVEKIHNDCFRNTVHVALHLSQPLCSCLAISHHPGVDSFPVSTYPVVLFHLYHCDNGESHALLNASFVEGICLFLA